MAELRKGPVGGRPFQKGQSGNPSGRRKVPVEVRDAARQWTEKAIATLAEVMANKREAATARVSAASVLLDRGWGKATQVVETPGAGDAIGALHDRMSRIEAVARAAFTASLPPDAAEPEQATLQ